MQVTTETVELLHSAVYVGILCLFSDMEEIRLHQHFTETSNAFSRPILTPISTLFIPYI